MGKGLLIGVTMATAVSLRFHIADKNSHNVTVYSLYFITRWLLLQFTTNNKMIEMK